MKNAIIFIVIILIIAGGAYWLWTNQAAAPAPVEPGAGATTTPPVVEDKTKTVIGQSVEGRDIVAYHFGEGADRILFVGGIHGGYSWNTPLLAYELMDYLKANPSAVPSNITVTVIPVLNPDGLTKVVGTTTKFAAADVAKSKETQVAGRFNANEVDLNRNFDCEWQPEATWQSKKVSGGSAAFSEPESRAVKNYIEANKPKAAVVWYSAAGGVFASNCRNGDGVMPETLALTNTYAKAAGYKAYESFDFYETTGDMVNWLAKNNIPAISVLLTNYSATEWSKNKAGIESILKYYAK